METKVKTGSVLPNGAMVLFKTEQGNGYAVTLCVWEKNGGDEYITWKTDVNTGDCHWGHYFQDQDSAYQNYISRVQER